MKKILKILIALSIALMLYIVISDSFTTVKAGILLQQLESFIIMDIII